MSPERHDWAELLRLLDTALDLDEHAREPWLTALPPPQQTRLRGLLARRGAVAAADFLARPAALDAPTAVARSGQRVGPWQLLREIGSGGMAWVWLAERADGQGSRRVALKLPRLGWAPGLADRMASERDILARLEHPHIARLYDAGVDALGRPWLALEYVQGLPIDRHAQARQLDLRARIALLLQVAEAVAFAHSRHVLHHDLKPSNILVGDSGSAHLLDFGIARLMQSDGDEAAGWTQAGSRALTPGYASPEQIAGQPLSAASDLYALGVVAYELLAGARPYRLERGTAAELERAVLSATIAAPSRIAADPADRRALRGDLDAVLLKALKRDPTERYASVQAFADDIQRALRHEAVQARPDSWAYRARQWVRRRPLESGLVAALAIAVPAGAAAQVAVMLALGLGAAATLWQARKAREQARHAHEQAARAHAQTLQAQAVQAFLGKVLAYNDPQQALGRERSARELLALAAASIDSDFADQPAVRASLHQTVGEILFELGQFADAARHLQQALALHEQQAPAGHAPTVAVLYRLGLAQRDLRDFAAAGTSFARALTAGNQLGPVPHAYTGRILASQAWLAAQTGQSDAVLPLAEAALHEQRAYSGPRAAEYLEVAQNVAALQIGRGRLDEAQALIDEIERLLPAVPGFTIVNLLTARAQLATVRFSQGEHAAAESLFADLLPELDRHIGPAFDRTAIARSTYARTCAERGRVHEAVALQQANIDNVLPRAAAEPEAVNLVRLQLVRLLTMAGRAAEAEALARELLAFLSARQPQPTRYREGARAFLADAVLAQGRRDEGLQLLQTAMDHSQQLGAADNPVERANRQLQWAVAARALPGADAVARAAAAHQSLAGALGPANPRTLKAAALRAWLQALAAPTTARAAAHAAFVAARSPVLTALPLLHALRAELLAAEAEIVGASDVGAAESLLAEAERLYLGVVGQPLPPHLLSLH